MGWDVTDLGITAFGAYIPRLRLARSAIAAAHGWMAPALKAQAKGTRAFCSWDEDSVTMAVEACRDAIGNNSVADVSFLGFASTRAPYADLQSSAIIAQALDLPHGIRAFDFANSQRAGTSGLIDAFNGEPGLFVAADAPLVKMANPYEMMFGAGAAAFLIGRDNVVARLLGAASTTENFVDHFRPAGERYDYFWEERWIRDEAYLKLAPRAIKTALAKAGLELADIHHFAMPSLLRNGAAAVARQLGFGGTLTDDLSEGCGYAGAAHAPLMLARALETASPGERILLVGMGQGIDALIFEVTDAIADLPRRRGVSGALADRLETDAYLRMLSFQDTVDLDWGMRAEKDVKTPLTEQYRSSGQFAAFHAGRCVKCGTVQFPQLEYCVDPQCHAPAAGFEQVSLFDAPARVLTFTTDWLSYHPAPPLYTGFIQFENGARVLMEMVDAGPDDIQVGTPLRMVFRIKDKDRMRGYRRYFWKATPLSCRAQGDMA